MLMSCCTLFVNSVAAEEENDVTRISDFSTTDEWKNYFGSDVKSTENAGSVWTDKTVLTNSSAFGNTGIGMDSNDDFLVALSAIASNKSVKGVSSMPTDTMLILDVSGSMNDNEGHNDLAEEMVEAANDSIAELLSVNKYSRVGVVLYSGINSGESIEDAAVLVLPLDRYTTASDGNYLSYTVTTSGGRHPFTTETVSLDSDVRVEKTGEKPKSLSKEVVGATYIQKGVMLAMEQFTDDSNTTTVDDSVLGTLQRKPVMVLMSDGAPTLGSTEFTNPKQYNLGTGSSTSTALGFVSQLSSAYAKQQIEEKYNINCLFYTLGLGVGNDSVATSVLNPSKSSDEINSLWNEYNAAEVGEKITVQSSSKGQSSLSVTKISQSIEQNYVDGFFKVDASSKDKAADLKKAFSNIVGTIQLQSNYYPTHVTDSDYNSGYITFSDQIGEYMEVTDMKGILLNNTLYSGAELAKDFSVSDDLASAVQSQLGIKDIETAKSLISSACEHGQISYSSDTEFSNYIGWYANADGEYLGFRYDGINSSFDDETQPAYVVKSYLYCGSVGEKQGVASSNMMYAVVQIKESITTGEQTVSFAVPASLIPVVSYNVTLNKNNEISNLTISGAEEPVRLVYGVSLKEEINEQTIRDKVSAEYLANNTNSDGSVNFYTNKYEADNSTGYEKVNTISCFTPSKQNEKFYCLKDSLVYSDDKGTLLKGDIDSHGEYYCACTVYENKNGYVQAETLYKRLSNQAIISAKQKDDGTWFIPAGSANVNLDGNKEKTENNTNTLNYSYAPFVNYQSDEKFNICSTLGNNGKLTIMPAKRTGNLIVAKEVNHDLGTDYEIPSDKVFGITVNLNGSDIADKTFSAVHTNGEVASVTTDENGSFTVNLKDDEQIEIFNLPEGTVADVKENNPSAGFMPEYCTNGQTGDGSVTITDKGTATVIVVNQYSAASVCATNISVTGEKSLTGREWKDSDSFTFELQKQISDAQWQTVATDTVKGTDADKSFDLSTAFSAESYSQTGIYNYRITEVEPETDKAGGIEYDKTVHSFGVAVTDKDMDGSLEISEVKAYTDSINVTQGDDRWAVKADFTNTYSNTDDASVTIDLYKNIENLSESPLIAYDGFKFGLYDDNGNLLSTQETDDSGFARFVCNYSGGDAVGTYKYTLKEISPDTALSGWKYSTEEIHVTVNVEDDGNGNLTAVIYSDSKQSDNAGNSVSVSFTNKYVPEKAELKVDFVNKKLTGRNLKADEFTFEVQNSDGSSILTGKNDEQGKVVFNNNLNFDKVGVFYYNIIETSGDGNGITADKTVYTIAVDVTDNGGKLEASYSVLNCNSQTIEFENIYNPSSVSYSISGQKTLTGRKLQDGEFTFVLSEAKNSSGDVDDDEAMLKTKNDADGAFSFEPVTFTKDGTYYFVVSEFKNGENDIIYDDTRYVVSITVTDDDKGNLVIQNVVSNVVGEELKTEIKFENKYIEPTKPTEATEPTEPTEVTEPTDPTEVTEPTEPTEATEPTEPTEVTEPTEPTEATEPTDPTEVTEPTKPTEATESTEQTESSKPTEPILPSNPIKPINPSIPSTPDEPKKTGNSGNSNDYGNTGTVKTVGAIQTGDDRNYYYMFASLIVSGMAFYGTAYYRKRREEK